MRITILFSILVLLFLPAIASGQATQGHLIFAATSEDGGRALYGLDLSNGMLSTLGAEPVSAPILNGETLAFTNADGQLNIASVNEFVEIRSELGHSVTSVAWLPNRIAYRAQRGGQESIYVAYIDNPDSIQVTGTNLEPDIIQVSPDGQRIIFTQTVVDTNGSGAIGLPGDTNRLYVADLRTGEILALTDGTFRVETPRWSPDGTRIAYIRVTDSNNDRRYTDVDRRQLWLTDNTGTIAQQLSPPEGVGAEGIIWNATGTHLLFVHQPDLDLNNIRSEGDPLRIARVTLQNGQFDILASTTRVTQLLASSDWFIFAAVTDDTNGDEAITPDDAPILHVVRVDGGTPTRISPEGFAVSGAIAFGEERLAFGASNGNEDAVFWLDLTAPLQIPEEPLATFAQLGQLAWNPAETILLASVDGGSLVTIERESGAVAERIGNNLVIDLTYSLLWVP